MLADEISHHSEVARRSVFVVDQSGTVRYAWRARSPTQQPNWEEVERAVAPFADGDPSG